MGRKRLPLVRFPAVSTRSVDQAVTVLARSHDAVQIVAVNRRLAFEWMSNRFALGDLEISASRLSTTVSGRAGDTRMYSMKVALSGGGRYTQNGHSAVMVPGKIALITSPSSASSLELAGGYEALQVTFPPAMVRTAMCSLTGDPDPPLPQFDLEADVEGERNASVLRLFRYLFDEAEQPTSAFTVPRLAQQVGEAFVLALVAHLRHDLSKRLEHPVRAAEPAHLRKVEAYIDAHVGGALSLGDLAAVAGVSGRAIQAGFRNLRGCSPMELVRARRLEEARRRLLAQPWSTITTVAYDCGFTNVGRFAASYRARFGENPRQTAARAVAPKRS
jgi:AraC-like DNA-binding protein